MDFKQIEAFVNVVRYKSFSKAADATFFTQPTISTHIRNLEKELGVKLLDRKSRTVEMTPQGNQFYKYAVEMINARSLAIDAINAGYGDSGYVIAVGSGTLNDLGKYVANMHGVPTLSVATAASMDAQAER